MRLLVVTLMCMLSSFASGGCTRPCITEENCKKTCDCENNETGDEQACTMAFRCIEPSEGAREKVCEPEYDTIECDELCTRFAANALCGTKRCDADKDCERKMTCDIFNADGEPTGQKFDCTLPFQCSAAEDVCPVAFTRTELDLCSTCCLNPGAPCL